MLLGRMQPNYTTRKNTPNLTFPDNQLPYACRRAILSLRRRGAPLLAPPSAKAGPEHAEATPTLFRPGPLPPLPSRASDTGARSLLSPLRP